MITISISYLYVDKLITNLQRYSWTKIEPNNSNKLGKNPQLISNVKAQHPEVFAPYSITLKYRDIFRELNFITKT